MKSNLYKAEVINVSNAQDAIKKRIIYVVAKTMLEAANKMVEELSVDDELHEISQISSECYV